MEAERTILARLADLEEDQKRLRDRVETHDDQIVPFVAIAVATTIADRLAELHRGREVAIEVRTDVSFGYHLAFLAPGETSRVPDNALADIRKAREVTLRRR